MPYSRIVDEDVHDILASLGAELDPIAGTTILITGAAGFLMSYLVDVIIAWNATGRGAPCRVLAVDNFKTGLPGRPQPGWRAGDRPGELCLQLLPLHAQPVAPRPGGGSRPRIVDGLLDRGCQLLPASRSPPGRSRSVVDCLRPHSLISWRRE